MHLVCGHPIRLFPRHVQCNGDAGSILVSLLRHEYHWSYGDVNEIAIVSIFPLRFIRGAFQCMSSCVVSFSDAKEFSFLWHLQFWENFEPELFCYIIADTTNAKTLRCEEVLCRKCSSVFVQQTHGVSFMKLNFRNCWRSEKFHDPRRRSA